VYKYWVWANAPFAASSPTWRKYTYMTAPMMRTTTFFMDLSYLIGANKQYVRAAYARIDK